MCAECLGGVVLYFAIRACEWCGVTCACARRERYSDHPHSHTRYSRMYGPLRVAVPVGKRAERCRRSQSAEVVTGVCRVCLHNALTLYTHGSRFGLWY